MEGLGIAVAREIAATILGDQNKVEFKEAPLATRIGSLKDGSIDIVAATYIITEDRLKDVDFSVVYYQGGGRFLVRGDSPIKGLADMDGKKVGVPQGSIYATLLPKLTKAQIVEVASMGAASQSLIDKQVDAVTSIDVNLYGLALLNPTFKVVGNAYTTESLGIGMAKGHPELLEAVNGVIKNLKSSGKWKSFWKAEIGDKFGMASIPNPPGDDWRNP
jgi:aspartate/glutamate/glutamine transport system substrate-binding protein